MRDRWSLPEQHSLGGGESRQGDADTLQDRGNAWKLQLDKETRELGLK